MDPLHPVTRKRFTPALMLVLWICIMLWVADVLVSVSFLLGRTQSAGKSLNWSGLDFAVSSGLGVMVFILWKLCRSGQGTYDHAIQQAVHDERARIAHELHDGLGFQLLSTLSRPGESPREIAQMRGGLEKALIDLHAMIDCIESEDLGLLDLMANLRYRIQPALDRQGITMRWNVPEDLVLTELSGPWAKHLVKITQEALSNTLQHATATEVEVSLTQSDDHTGLTLQVRDNGCGVTASDTIRNGMGLEGIRRRAKLLGADLLFAKGLHGKGIGICVHLPHVVLPNLAAH